MDPLDIPDKIEHGALDDLLVNIETACRNRRYELEEAAITDSEALDRLHDLLSGREWDADTINTVAYLVTLTGRVVADTNPEHNP
jgi:hypothetical protein